MSRSFGQKSKFWSKIKILVKQSKQILAKIKIFLKNRNFVEKLKFWSKIEFFFKNRNFVLKSKFWRKIEILVKNQNFGQKSKFCSKIKIFVTNSKKMWWKIEISDKNRNFWRSKISKYIAINSRGIRQQKCLTLWLPLRFNRHVVWRLLANSRTKIVHNLTLTLPL